MNDQVKSNNKKDNPFTLSFTLCMALGLFIGLTILRMISEPSDTESVQTDKKVLEKEIIESDEAN